MASAAAGRLGHNCFVHGARSSQDIRDAARLSCRREVDRTASREAIFQRTLTGGAEKTPYIRFSDY